jgi:hypothetical protein
MLMTTPGVPVEAVRIVGMLAQQALDTHAQLREIDRALIALQRTDDMARRLATVPGIGPSVRPRWPQPSPIPASSAPGGSSLPGSD